jgi:hypothetical protein
MLRLEKFGSIELTGAQRVGQTLDRQPEIGE